MTITPDGAEAEHPFFRELDYRQETFDALRPACPGWCNDECNHNLHFGDAVHHTTEDSHTTSAARIERGPRAVYVAPTIELGCDADYNGVTGQVRLHGWRYDSLNNDGQIDSGNFVEVDLLQSGSAVEECAQFTPSQARSLAAEILRLADLLDPEQDVPAEQVRVGDYLQVGGEWRYVYGVDHDEPSHTVKLFPTVDRSCLPEVDGDEDDTACFFEPGTPVRIRRGGAL